ncbi:MAG: ABC transporter permease, partial [Myxococcales bacterium]
MGILMGRILAQLVRLRFDTSEFVRSMYKMGVKSVPIVVVTALFVGGIMVIQAAPIVKRYGAYGLLGWGAGFGTLREIGPLLTALMLSGRVGANNTAELGTMVVTE